MKRLRSPQRPSEGRAAERRGARGGVTGEVYPTVVLDDDKRVREAVGPQLQRLMQSDKVREGGILTGKRGGFFLVDIDSPEELYELLGPEIVANFKLEVHPVTPLDKIGEIFQRWATEGR